jgi:hypothetical protein
MVMWMVVMMMLLLLTMLLKTMLLKTMLLLLHPYHPRQKHSDARCRLRRRVRCARSRRGRVASRRDPRPHPPSPASCPGATRARSRVRRARLQASLRRWIQILRCSTHRTPATAPLARRHRRQHRWPGRPRQTAELPQIALRTRLTRANLHSSPPLILQLQKTPHLLAYPWPRGVTRVRTRQTRSAGRMEGWRRDVSHCAVGTGALRPLGPRRGSS